MGIRFLRVHTGVKLETNNFSNYSASVILPAPVPAFGLFGSAYMTQRLRVLYNFDYFSIAINGIQGAVLDNRFALEYYFIKNLGVGGSLKYMSYQVKELPLSKDFEGEVKYTLSGFSIFFTARF